MTIDEYQQATQATATYQDRGHNVNYAVVGLCGEVGELANKWKKCFAAMR